MKTRAASGEGLVMSFTDKECVPVHRVMYTGETCPTHHFYSTHTTTLDIQDSSSTQIYDVVLGIPDPNAFLVPAECAGAQWITNADEHVHRSL